MLVVDKTKLSASPSRLHRLCGAESRGEIKDFKLVLVSFLHFVINRVELYLVLFQMGAFKYRKPEVGCQRNWILV